MTKLVVISDTHVHPWSAFATGTGLENDRMRRTLDVMRASLDRARDEGAVWVHGADIIHTTGHVRHEVASAVIDLLREYEDVPMVTVWGNHDSRGRGSRVRQEESFQHVLVAALPHLILLDGDISKVDDVTFTGLGAQPRPDMLDIEGLPDADICVLHSQVAGASFPTGMISDGLNPDQLLRFPLSVVGDIHHPHVHAEDDSVILIPGSPEHHNFGDRGERGWWVVDVQPGGPVMDNHVEFVPSGSPEFRTVGSVDDVADDGHFYRVVGEVSGALPENATAVATGPTTVEARDLLEGASEARDVVRKWVELNDPPTNPGRAIRTGLDLLGNVEHTPPRKAKIQRVELRNFFSHADTTWDVEPGVHAIVGHSADFNSNGAGKSTLPDAVYWALYGKTTKGVAAADVIRWGESKASVRLVIDLDGKDLIVKRTRTTSGGDLVVTIDDEPLEAETTTKLGAALEAMLGFDPDLYRSLGYFSQEDVVLLSQATDAEIKNRLADLRGTAAYEQGAERARAAVKEATTKEANASGRFKAMDEQLADAIDAVAAARSRANTWDTLRKDRVEDAETALADAREALKECEENVTVRMRSATEDMESKLEEFRARLDANLDDATETLAREMTSSYDAERQRLESEIVNIMAGIPEGTKAATAQDEVDRAEEALRHLEERHRSLNATLTECKNTTDALRKEAKARQRELEQAQAGTCPTCGQETAADPKVVESIREKLADVMRRQESNLKREADAVAELNDLKPVDDAKVMLADRKRIAKAVREVAEKRGRLADLKEKAELVTETARERARAKADRRYAARKEELEAEVRKVTTKMEEAVHHARAARDSAEAEAERVRAEENPHRDAVRAAVDREASTRSARWRARLKARRAQRAASVAEYWAEGFGKGGVQSLLIDELAAAFNGLRGVIVPTLTRGVYDVQFSTTSRTQAGELRERIEFQVYRHGERIPYANLSGGQRRRVDLGVLLTMTMAASRMYGVPGTLGLMVLDEVTSFLDDDGAEALAEVLSEYAENVVPAVYVVSQEESLRSLFPSVLTVVQDEDGVSGLQEVA